MSRVHEYCCALRKGTTGIMEGQSNPTEPTLQCRTCGAAMAAGNAFCRACGSPVAVSAPPPPPIAAPLGPESPVQLPPQTSAQPLSEKASMWIALKLAVVPIAAGFVTVLDTRDSPERAVGY